MPKAPGRPSLDDFLAATKGSNGPCIYVRATTPEQRRLIREKYDEGHRRWVAFQRWLASEGVDINSHGISFHFSRGHADDR